VGKSVGRPLYPRPAARITSSRCSEESANKIPLPEIQKISRFIRGAGGYSDIGHEDQDAKKQTSGLALIASGFPNFRF
jgi:hypothetical protein